MFKKCPVFFLFSSDEVYLLFPYARLDLSGA